MAKIDLSASTGDYGIGAVTAPRDRGAARFSTGPLDSWSEFDPAVALSSSGGSDFRGPPNEIDPATADYPALFDLGSLNGANGFRIEGSLSFDYIGGSVSSAGDVNGDGLDDIIVGAPRVNVGSEVDAGASYVIFGQAAGFSRTFALESLDGANGFRIDGTRGGDISGVSVSSAGDFNGDGFDDIVIGAEQGGERASGESYIVFGKAGGFDASLDLAALDGTDGFRIVRSAPNTAYDGMGQSVSSAGDINGDGFDDVVIGAPEGNPDFTSNGLSFVVFGKAGGFSPVFDLRALNGANGFRIDGIDPYDRCGYSVSSAGDVNGDGVDDIIIGADFAESRGSGRDSGESYVVFGKNAAVEGQFDAVLDMADLDGNNGFRIDGARAGDASGRSVSCAGDVNGDGLSDILICAEGADAYTGESYVVFGKREAFQPSLDLATLDGANGFRIVGADPGGSFYAGAQVSSAGDVNGDGFDDILFGIGAGYSGNEARAGSTFLIFGKAGGFSARFDLATLDGTNGLRIEGADAFDLAGRVSSAGDINGDGFDDIMIGAILAEPPDKLYSGEAYVVYGRAPSEAVRRVGSAADQEIRGGDFDDTLAGRGGDDLLVGAGGDDHLFGGHGRDTLEGGAGDDRLGTGRGGDRLTGGAGADLFVLDDDLADGDRARITDFVSGTDRFGIDAEDFGGGLTPGMLDPDAFVVNTIGGAEDADDRFIYNSENGRLFYDADGSGAGERVLIAILNDAPMVTAGDFIVV